MPSAADLRRRLEAGARTVAVVALAAALARLLVVAGGGGTAVHARVDGAIAPRERDSLVALARAGERLEWSGVVVPIAATSEPVRDPSARTRLLVAGEGRAGFADSLGALDSLAAGTGSVAVAATTGLVRVSASTSSAITHARTGEAPGRLLVLGRVNWESKFVIAALEEAGWAVDARLRLSDTLRITQGRPGEPTRATHAAVVVLDSVVDGSSEALVRYVRSGGGLVLAGAGANARGLAALAPARAGTRVDGEAGAFDRNDPVAALPVAPLLNLKRDAVPLDRRGERLLSAARRVGAGRVVQSGLGETWRWRMQAERDGAEEHRAHWNRLVAAAAAAPVPSGRADTASTRATVDANALDEAPLATLIERLGPASPAAAPTVPRSNDLPIWLGALALVLLLGEWASRRARGAA